MSDGISEKLDADGMIRKYQLGHDLLYRLLRPEPAGEIIRKVFGKVGQRVRFYIAGSE